MRTFPTLLAAALLVSAAPALAPAQDDPAPAATAKPKVSKQAQKKPGAMSDEKRRQLEERIQALEQTQEMGYRDTPGSAADAPVAPGLIDDE